MQESPNTKGEGPGDAFASMAKEVRGEEKWYSFNWAMLKEYKTLYTITACLSFFLLTLFGIVTIVPGDDCYIQQHDDGRCCSCLAVNASRAQGQRIEYFLGLNSVFYGIVMVVNSCFGFYYVLVGVRTENKYQLSCMIITQVLEVARALFDTWFETNPTLQDRFIVREVLAYSSLFLLIVSAALIPPLYKQFGWSIFRRGGVLKPVRERYKIYQMFRAFNRLDVQSSSLLFLVFGLYLSFVWRGGWWIFACILVCDVFASRWMVRYLKRETPVGFYISMVAKTFVVIWWLIVTAEYISCSHRYYESVVEAESFWRMDPYPSFASVKATYNGVNCLNPFTHHDDRTWELLLMNLIQAIFFRVGSMIYGVRVATRFGGGLKTVFYKEMALANSEEDNKIPEGGQAIKFKAKKKKSKSNTHRDNDDEELTDRNNGEQEYHHNGDDDQAHSVAENDTNYQRFEASNDNNGSDDEEDAMMQQHGVSTREMRDDMAW